MISFQVPPDLALYTGVRDSSKPGGLAPPKGVTAPGAVKVGEYAKQNGFFISPPQWAPCAGAAAYRKLRIGRDSSPPPPPPMGEAYAFRLERSDSSQ